MLTAFTASLLIIMSGMAAAEPFRCEIAQKFVCSPAGCAKGKLGISNIVDIDLGKFSRCDANGCDEYSANFTRSDAYIVVNVPGGGMVAKLSTNGSEYLEVATLGNTALISFGSCRPMQSKRQRHGS